MSKINWRVALGAVGVGVSLLMGGQALIGCSDGGGSARPAVSQLQEGLTLIDTHDAAWGMSAAFREGSRVVYLETRVGAPKPDVYQQSYPDEPKNEMDMRMVDGLGNTFYVQRGGDQLIDPTWADDLRQAESLKTQPPEAERAAYWTLAGKAATVVHAQAPAGFEDHAFHFAQFAAAPPNLDQRATLKLDTMRTEFQTNKAYDTWSSGSTAQTYVQTWHKSVVCALWTCVGTHTPTVMYYAMAGATVWSAAINACNHGTCGGGSGTRGGCYSTGGFFSVVNYNGETLGGLSISGGCNTGYNWDTPPGHECNEDAAYELWQATEGTYETSLGDMNNFDWVDGNGHNYACNCSASSNGCSGDWSGPACP